MPETEKHFHIGRQLRSARLKSLYPKTHDFAEQAHMDIDILMAIERDEFVVTRTTAARLANIAGISVEQLINNPTTETDNQTGRIEEKTLQLIREMSEINLNTGNSQEIYVTEECSELIKELMKDLRNKSDEEALIDEACDVLLTTLTLLYQHNVSWDCILAHFKTKIDRAKDRLQAGEI